jgi:hypothetical protein
MGIRVEGMDEIQKQLREIQRNVDPTAFNEWANHIARSAKVICNDPDCKRIRLTKDKEGNSIFEFSDTAAIDCVIQSIKNHMHEMPLVQKDIFEDLITRFENMKNDFKP